VLGIKFFFEARERTKVSGWKDCIKILEKAKADGLVVTPDQKGCFLLSMGQCERKLGNLAVAKKYCQEAFEEKVKVETWVTPHALTEIGAILIAEGQVAEGVKLLNKAKNTSNYDNYDFRNILLREITLLIDKSNGAEYNMFLTESVKSLD